MTKAIDWVRANAKQFDQYVLEADGAKYIATWFSFKGRIPSRMVYELKSQLGELITTDTENEVLRLGGQYRSDFNKCVFTRTTYEQVV